MKYLKTIKFLSFILVLLLLIGCSEREGKKQQQNSKEFNEQQISETTNAESGDTTTATVAGEDENRVMSPKESDILNRMINAYEKNSTDLLNWSTSAVRVSNVNEAINTMMEYIDVQKRFNNDVKEIEDYTAKELGEDHEFSTEYENTLQGFLSDPQRIVRSKKVVGATMKLINQYGDDPRFQEIMKELEEMNRHKMKELNDPKE